MTKLTVLSCCMFVLLFARPPHNVLSAEPGPWWDQYPRIVQTTDLAEAVRLGASVHFNQHHSDPGWGLWRQQATIEKNAKMSTARREAGLRSISYFETFGQLYCYAVELTGSPDVAPATSLATHWNWQSYAGGPVVWSGPQTYFDDEPFARPYTRTHHRYGGPAMRYPDGRVASGYSGLAQPPFSRVLDAGGAKDVLGRLSFTYHYNQPTNRPDPITGKPVGAVGDLVHVPESGQFTSLMLARKDSACPMWIDYTRASTLQAADAGCEGMWSDNFSPWDSWNSSPVDAAFGEWSVARFRDYLAEHFSLEDLSAMGVEEVDTFDVREYLRLIATDLGWDGQSLRHRAWRDRRWLEDPLWTAYAIYKRQTGTEALSRYYRTVKAAGAEAGCPDFLVSGNDIPMFNLGWARGDLDMVSTEMSAGWKLGSGSRGIMLPPAGRFAPVYKLAREHAKSRFVNVWMYHEGFEGHEREPNLVSTIYYEMLANHAIPMIMPSNERFIGTPEANHDFLQLVSRVAPEFGDRRPLEEIGVYYSDSAVLANMTPGGFADFDAQPSRFAYWGWATALGQSHYQYRAVPEWKLDAKLLSGLRLLILPDAAILDPRVVEETLEPWVRAGGRLIVTGESGSRLAEEGNFATNKAGFALAPLTGVSNLADAPKVRVTEVGGGKVLYLRETPGREYYVSGPAERAELLPRLKEAVREVLKGQAGPLVVEADGLLPDTVGLTVYTDPARRRLFLDVNNLDVDVATDSITPTRPLVFRATLPQWLRETTVQARVLSPEGSPPKATISSEDSDGIMIRLSPIRGYASVVIEPAP